MPRKSAPLFTALALLTALMSIGCGGSKPARFYLFEVEPSDQQSTPGSATSDLTIIGILPVELPDYLMRPQIASRAEGHRVEYADYDRWAEPLQDTLLRLASQDLERALPGHITVEYPWPANLDIKYRLHLEFQYFDLYETGTAELKAKWAIGVGHTGRWVRHGSLVLTEDFQEGDKPDYPARVAALNRLVVRMNQQVADEVRSFLHSLASP